MIYRDHNRRMTELARLFDRARSHPVHGPLLALEIRRELIDPTRRELVERMKRGQKKARGGKR